MAAIKCKMCGGTIEFEEGSKVGTCEFCGTKQTIPSTDDEVITNLFNRANNLRLKSEFDKAEQIYEKIVQQNDAEPEAHWGIVLCKYGIEYVEDPKTYERIPTCHRTLFESVKTDPDYEAAIDFADISQQAIYEKEARQIDAIQRGILEIAKNEEPFDVFICYKETDDTGVRTQDSVIANDIYYQLTQEGFKVFYAAITLEDKLGQEYEPYIFAALNSARVMLAIGTKPEYFNAVWVKNEWSRYLKLLKNDNSKLLIPCYKDMDAYDLPEEFAHLQAQDMGKIGFINDVVRGIKKVLNKGEEENTPAPAGVSGAPQTSNVTALLQRGELALEDEEWEKADEFFEEVLNQDAQCAAAYFGKLMAELRVAKPDGLKNLQHPFDKSKNYEKIQRFGNDKLKVQIDAIVTFINNRNSYAKAIETMNNATSGKAFGEVADMFKALGAYKDSADKCEQCRKKADELGAKEKQAEEERQQAIILAVAAAKVGIENKDRLAAPIAELEEETASIKRFDTIVAGYDSVRAEMECLLESINSIGQEKTAMEEKRNGLGLFVGKEKKQLKTAIVDCEKNIEANKEQFEILKEKLGGFESKIAAEAESQKHRNRADELKAEIEKIKNENNKTLTYEEAVALIKEQPEIRDMINIEAPGVGMSLSEIGEKVQFGNYNGPIEWRVLDKKDDRVLIITDKIIDAKPYNDEYVAITWENCALRKWLNEEFLRAAFTEKAQGTILQTNIKNEDNPEHGTNGGKDTKDKAFLLSIDEAEKYFSSDADRQAEGTEYAKTTELYVADNGYSWWWLRSPGRSANYAAFVFDDGDVNGIGYDVSIDINGIRPVLWVDISNL